MRMSFRVNNSPFMGREGVHSTSRNLHERLMNELRTNVSLRVETTSSPDVFPQRRERLGEESGLSWAETARHLGPALSLPYDVGGTRRCGLI